MPGAFYASIVLGHINSVYIRTRSFLEIDNFGAIVVLNDKVIPGLIACRDSITEVGNSNELLAIITLIEKGLASVGYLHLLNVYNRSVDFDDIDSLIAQIKAKIAH